MINAKTLSFSFGFRAGSSTHIAISLVQILAPCDNVLTGCTVTVLNSTYSTALTLVFDPRWGPASHIENRWMDAYNYFHLESCESVKKLRKGWEGV